MVMFVLYAVRLLQPSLYINRMISYINYTTVIRKTGNMLFHVADELL